MSLILALWRERKLDLFEFETILVYIERTDRRLEKQKGRREGKKEGREEGRKKVSRHHLKGLGIWLSTT